jgi:two-component system, chemotaxis family, protein-glutamate methylesterase/glutaminase
VTRRVELVVIGGSAGSFDVLRDLLRGLTSSFAPAMAIVVHLPPSGPSLLPEIFSTESSPPMKLADDKEPIAGGTIYFASHDYHLLIGPDRTFALSQDERVHFSRPAIDVLFESAAEAYGAGVLGVILSGASADGAQGLRAIADAGGLTAVQALDTAEMTTMPAAALEAVPASIVVNAGSLAELLRALGEVDGR